MITGRGAGSAPATDDIDVVVEATIRVECERINERLCDVGLSHDMSQDAPICRWITPTDGLRPDVMPSEEHVPSF